MATKKRVPERYLLPTKREKDEYMAKQDAELARLRAENERLRAALRKCEWGGFRMHGPSGSAMSVCPVCRNNPTDFHGKHSFGCEIAAALKAEP